MGGAFNANHFGFLLLGAAWTIGLTGIAFIGGGLVGFLVALGRVSSVALLRWALAAYVQMVQGTPLLVLIFLMYFGVAMAGFELGPLAAAGLSMTIYVSAYIGEIWRGCIESVPRTQWEAAECLPLTKIQRMRLVVLPQAFKIATPPTVGFMVQIVKSSSLASVVGFVELTRAGQLVNNSVFEPLVVFLVVAIIYFALCYPLSWWSRRLEARLGVHAPVQSEPS
jgi:polar amino acid transport system permease protein